MKDKKIVVLPRHQGNTLASVLHLASIGRKDAAKANRMAREAFKDGKK